MKSLFGSNKRDINLILENIIFIEALRRGYIVHAGKCKGQEVDFVCYRQDKKLYIQVCDLLASEETIRREFDVYLKEKDNYPKFVISLDKFDISQNGIIHKNIKDFLLEDMW